MQVEEIIGYKWRCVMIDKRKFFELDENRSIEEILEMMEYIDKHGPLTNKDLEEAFPEMHALYWEGEKNKVQKNKA